MNKYIIFGKQGEVITRFYADDFYFHSEIKLVKFLKDKEVIAWFNLETIAGFCKAEA